ncbi:STN domain-containing protein [Asaia astilbis]|uniref:STN domain-containing protein n=1 Tax=Asaia astilbis TaxID=610244 RepID=UPI00055FF796|nr:STN domain-containing protein [Asaia astilbis]
MIRAPFIASRPRRNLALLLLTFSTLPNLALAQGAAAPVTLSQSDAAKALTVAQPAGTLEDALTGLARQSGRDILFSSDQVRGKKAAALKGRLTLEKALERLLGGSGSAPIFSLTGLWLLRLLHAGRIFSTMPMMKGQVRSVSR